MNNEQKRQKVMDLCAAVKTLKENNILTEQELYPIYNNIRELLGLPPRDFVAEKFKLSSPILDENMFWRMKIDINKEESK